MALNAQQTVWGNCAAATDVAGRVVRVPRVLAAVTQASARTYKVVSQIVAERAAETMVVEAPVGAVHRDIIARRMVCV